MTNKINRSEEQLRKQIEADEKKLADPLLDKDEKEWIQENLCWGYDTLSEYEISGRCDQCGRFTSVKTHGHFYPPTGGRYEPEEPAELYCPRCDRKNRYYMKKHR